MPSTLVVHQYGHLVHKRISSSLINGQLINPHEGKNGYVHSDKKHMTN